VDVASGRGCIGMVEKIGSEETFKDVPSCDPVAGISLAEK
jgi:hypothetical protein